MTKTNAEVLLESVSTLLRVFILDETRFPSAEGRMRYNPIDFQTLRYISKHPQCKGADIARALGVAPTTQQSALDRLIRKGFVARGEHPTSKRAKVHKLTDEGQALRAAIHRQDISNMETMLSLLNDEEKKQIITIMTKVAQGLSE